MDEQTAALLAQIRPELRPEISLWWPPAWGWWLVLVAALTSLVGVCWWYWRRRRDQRRYAFIDQALAQLRLIANSGQDARSQLLAINALLKRAAITAYPDAGCAALDGASWLQFLDARGHANNFAAEHDLLCSRYQRQAHPDPAALQRFAAQARAWLLVQKKA